MISEESKITILRALGTKLRLNINGTTRKELCKAFTEVYEDTNDQETRRDLAFLYGQCTYGLRNGNLYITQHTYYTYMTPELKHPTKQEYMDGKVTHEEYYEAIAAEAGISFENSNELPKIRDALAKDEHLNNIPLRYWDMLAEAARYLTAPVFKAHGDSWSLAGGVCIAKAAARKAARAL